MLYFAMITLGTASQVDQLSAEWLHLDILQTFSHLFYDDKSQPVVLPQLYSIPYYFRLFVAIFSLNSNQYYSIPFPFSLSTPKYSIKLFWIPLHSTFSFPSLFYSLCILIQSDTCVHFYSILFYSILFYSILFYSILFYSILFYSILFYSILLLFEVARYDRRTCWWFTTKINRLVLLILFHSILKLGDEVVAVL